MQCFQQKLFIFNENYSAAHSETKSTFCLVGSQHYHQHTQTLFQLTLKSFTAWWCHKTLQQANITNLMENFQFFHIKLPQIFTWGHSLQPQLDRSINFKYIFFSIAYFKCIFFYFQAHGYIKPYTGNWQYNKMILLSVPWTVHGQAFSILI